MGGIAEDHVEWAVINRMKAMLDAPPETPFNVTQSFAPFTSIVIWTKNRMWVAGNPGHAKEWTLPADGLAHEARLNLQNTAITDAPCICRPVRQSWSILPTMRLTSRSIVILKACQQTCFSSG
jgi:hypothetical protein